MNSTQIKKNKPSFLETQHRVFLLGDHESGGYRLALYLNRCHCADLGEAPPL